MSTSKKTSPEVPSDEVLQQLADLARVPAAHRDFYSDSIRITVQTACERQELVKEGLTRKQGAALYRAALTLHEMLGELTQNDRHGINTILGGKSKFIFDRISSGALGGLRQTAYQVALLFSLLTGKPYPRYPHETKPRKKGRRAGGRRPGSVKDPIFQDFICDLWISTNAAGGKLSFEKNTPRGTVFTAIKLLSPHLPKGFVPKALPASTVQKLKNLCNRAELSAAASD